MIIQEEIEQMLLECRTLGIEVIFVPGLPGSTTDPKKIIISKNDDEQTIKNILEEGIVHYLRQKEDTNKECPGLKYEKFYNTISPFGIEANIDQQLERIKNKYMINDQKEVREKDPLPKRWSDLVGEVQRDASATIVECNPDIEQPLGALATLYDLRKEYWRIANWEPDWYEVHQPKYVILRDVDGDITTTITFTGKNYFLAFPSPEQVDHFLNHHIELIEKAEEFI